MIQEFNPSKIDVAVEHQGESPILTLQYLPDEGLRIEGENSIVFSFDRARIPSIVAHETMFQANSLLSIDEIPINKTTNMERSTGSLHRQIAGAAFRMNRKLFPRLGFNPFFLEISDTVAQATRLKCVGFFTTKNAVDELPSAR